MHLPKNYTSIALRVLHYSALIFFKGVTKIWQANNPPTWPRFQATLSFSTLYAEK